LNFDLQGLSEIKGELLEIFPIDKLLELLPEGAVVDNVMPYPIMEGTVIVRIRALGLGGSSFRCLFERRN